MKVRIASNYYLEEFTRSSQNHTNVTSWNETTTPGDIVTSEPNVNKTNKDGTKTKVCKVKVMI